jgi:[ribosomal protein S5]-alanine N-acetyltransferase
MPEPAMASDPPPYRRGSPDREPPRLAGRRVALRGFREDDFDALFALHSDARVMRYWSFPAWTAPEQARDYFSRGLAANDPDEMLCWVITLPPAVTLAGTATLASIDRAQGRAEIGYALGSAHWGRGLAREAVSLVLDHAFGVLGLRRVEADIDPRNNGSMRLARSLGFRREGLLRERWQVAGETCDSAWHGLLAREWHATRGGTDAHRSRYSPARR